VLWHVSSVPTLTDQHVLFEPVPILDAPSQIDALLLHREAALPTLNSGACTVFDICILSCFEVRQDAKNVDLLMHACSSAGNAAAGRAVWR
jgi:hypothetical protein